ncbi:MAG: hypothetical protein KF681_15815 [Bdellovibrionaceae bacterium]|nr:hypothetical protein [Pseudobdellovibrionaceae bacterium]
MGDFQNNQPDMALATIPSDEHEIRSAKARPRDSVRKPALVSIDVNDIEADDSGRIRKADLEIQKSIRLGLEYGLEQPPIIVCRRRDGGGPRFKLIDGLNVLAAIRKMPNCYSVVVTILDVSSRAEEIQAEFDANIKHGKPIKDKDRAAYAKAFLSALTAEEVEKISGRQLAEKYRLSHTTGNKIRNEFLSVHCGHSSESKPDVTQSQATSETSKSTALTKKSEGKRQSGYVPKVKDGPKPKGLSNTASKERQHPAILLAESRDVGEIKDNMLSLALLPTESATSLFVCVVEYSGPSEELETRVSEAIAKAIKVKKNGGKRGAESISESEDPKIH